MTDRPILFSGPMVRALLDGRKTQTRRVLAPQPPRDTQKTFRIADLDEDGVLWMSDQGTHCAARIRYAVGDRLYVREAHYLTDDGDNDEVVCAVDEDAVAEHLAAVASLEARYPTADWSRHKRLRPPMHMPRWASRLTLTVTEVRVQRLQAISEDDAWAEGIQKAPDQEDALLTGVQCYQHLWDSLNADRGFGWEANPWIVAVTFTVERRNIDSAGEAAP